jgi:hypothetical protein
MVAGPVLLAALPQRCLACRCNGSSSPGGNEPNPVVALLSRHMRLVIEGSRRAGTLCAQEVHVSGDTARSDRATQ